MKSIYYLLFVGVLINACSGIPSSNQDVLGTISKLSQNIASSQIRTNVPFERFFRWEKDKGLYPSNIRLNFVGKPDLTLLRDSFAIFDNNMFVTTWITEILLHAQEFVPNLKISEQQIFEAINATSAFRDRNIDQEDSPVYIFWSQIEKNGTWVAWPENLKQITEFSEDFFVDLQTFLLDLGLDHLWDEISPQIGEFVDMFSSFKIPDDFDDSGCNLGLGSLLAEQQSNYPKSFSLWTQNNQNIEELISRSFKYSYQPFSDDWVANSIDPRSYFFFHEFLENIAEEAQKTGTTPSLSLITTWITNIQEDAKLYHKGIAMPFNVNNVDLSVSANFIHGTIRHLLFNSINGNNTEWFTPDVQQTLLNSTSLIEWAINSGRFLERPDLALLYYPPIYDLYWFISRTVFTLSNLQSSNNNNPIFQQFPVLQQIEQKMTNLMRGNGTLQILNLAQIDSSDGSYYWQEFLGLADLSWFGNPDPHADDRIFSTSVAINALIDTWSVKNSDSSECAISWIPGTPSTVQDVVQKASNWLLNNVLSGEYNLHNTFFSGSVKSMEQLPFFYPANLLQYLNGTALPPNPSPDYITDELICAMSGVLDSADYAQQLQSMHFDFIVPTNFSGFNIAQFPFWSSESLTEATSLLALSKFYSLYECHDEL